MQAMELTSVAISLQHCCWIQAIVDSTAMLAAVLTARLPRVPAFTVGPAGIARAHQRQSLIGPGRCHDLPIRNGCHNAYKQSHGICGTRRH